MLFARLPIILGGISHLSLNKSKSVQGLSRLFLSFKPPPQYLDRTLQEENDCHGGCHGVDFATLMVVVHPDSDAAASVEIPYIMLLCFFLVGLAPWTIPNALFAEIPSLAHDVPEGAAIGAWASIAIQISNIGSFAFFIAQRCSNKPIRPERVVAVVISHSHTRTLSYGT